MGVRLQQKPRTWHLDFESPTPGGLPSPWPPGVLQADKETEAGLYVQRPTLNPTTTGHRPPSPTSLCPLRPPPRQTAEYSTRGLGVDLGESRLTQWLPGPDHTANQWQSRARRGPVGSRSHLDTTLPRLLAIRGRAVQSLSSALLCLGPCGPVRRASPGGSAVQISQPIPAAWSLPGNVSLLGRGGRPSRVSTQPGNFKCREQRRLLMAAPGRQGFLQCSQPSGPLVIRGHEWKELGRAGGWPVVLEARSPPRARP